MFSLFIIPANLSGESYRRQENILFMAEPLDFSYLNIVSFENQRQ
jgi:hypothetical protein